MDLHIVEEKCSICGSFSYSIDMNNICYDCKSRLCISCKIRRAEAEQHTCELCGCHANINKLTDNLYITDYYYSKKYSYLKSIGIKQILTVASEILTHTCQDFEIMCIPANDLPEENILQYFETAHQFIDQAPTLIHCYAGISRSGTIAVSYIMKKLGMNAVDALHYCRLARPIITPNLGFLKQLNEYSKDLDEWSVSSVSDLVAEAMTPPASPEQRPINKGESSSKEDNPPVLTLPHVMPNARSVLEEKVEQKDTSETITPLQEYTKELEQEFSM